MADQKTFKIVMPWIQLTLQFNPCVLDPEPYRPHFSSPRLQQPPRAASSGPLPSIAAATPLRQALRRPASPSLPHPAPGLPFTAWRRHHRRGHPHGAVRPCQAFTVHPSPSSLFLSPFPSLSIYHLLVFLPWRRRLGERRWCYSVFAGPFAATSTHQVCPPLPFLICETEHPKP